MLLLAGMLVASMSPAYGQFDLAVEQQLLKELARDGKYGQARAEGLRVQQALKPKAGGKSGALQKMQIDLLRYRCTVERALGDFDAADKLQTEAERLFSDKDFQRWIATHAPQATDAQQLGDYYLPWSVTWFGLLDDRGENLLARLHEKTLSLSAATTSSGTAAPPTQEQLDAISRLCGTVDETVRVALQARATSAARLPDDEQNPASRSPYVHVIFGSARPLLLAGRRYLEAAKLPTTIAADAIRTDTTTKQAPPAESADERRISMKRQLRRAIEYLEKAIRDTDAACATALSPCEDADKTGDQSQCAEARQEAGRLRAAARQALAEVLLFDGDAEQAREMIDTALVDLRGAEIERHPALVRPLLLSAQIGLEEASLRIARKEAVDAQACAAAAEKALREAKTLLGPEQGYPPPSPATQALLTTLSAAIDAQVKKTGQLVAARDAADAAARKALQAIKASDAPRPAPAPQP